MNMDPEHWFSDFQTNFIAEIPEPSSPADLVSGGLGTGRISPVQLRVRTGPGPQQTGKSKLS